MHDPMTLDLTPIDPIYFSIVSDPIYVTTVLTASKDPPITQNRGLSPTVC